jgi:site-specific DNA-methyltransferase (adenine-specific)
MELNKIYNEDNIMGMARIPDNSIDCILTDPPYLYLKNQKLDRPFDEALFFSECKRVLKKEGFIVLFGRGTSFYRWNTMLADLGFKFKEEIIWDKSYCSSPLMKMSRMYETVSIHSMAGTINKVKVPYLEMKGHDIPSICQDIKRLCAALNSPKSLNEVLHFLENNRVPLQSRKKTIGLTISSPIESVNRCVSVINQMQEGMNEKSIIRTDRCECDVPTKFGINFIKSNLGNRCVNVMQSVEFGLNEKTIIRETGDHYSAIHPTQKPVRLLERLLALTTKPGDIVLDPFAGSCSTAVACYNTDRQFICFEIDKEYYDLASDRVRKVMQQMKIDFNN